MEGGWPGAHTNNVLQPVPIWWSLTNYVDELRTMGMWTTKWSWTLSQIQNWLEGKTRGWKGRVEGSNSGNHSRTEETDNRTRKRTIESDKDLGGLSMDICMVGTQWNEESPIVSMVPHFHSPCERPNRLTWVLCFRWRQSGQRPCLIRSIELFIVCLGLTLVHEMRVVFALGKLI